LFPNNNGGIIDTPGIREIFIKKIEPEKLADFFVEFRQFAGRCSFSSCLHVPETGCAIKNAVDNGLINADRYKSYLKLYEEMTVMAEDIYGSTYT
jgi:ribosome biogenesis GTPase